MTPLVAGRPPPFTRQSGRHHQVVPGSTARHQLGEGSLLPTKLSGHCRQGELAEGLRILELFDEFVQISIMNCVVSHSGIIKDYASPMHCNITFFVCSRGLAALLFCFLGPKYIVTN